MSNKSVSGEEKLMMVGVVNTNLWSNKRGEKLPSTFSSNFMQFTFFPHIFLESFFLVVVYIDENCENCVGERKYNAHKTSRVTSCLIPAMVSLSTLLLFIPLPALMSLLLLLCLQLLSLLELRYSLCVAKK